MHTGSAAGKRLVNSRLRAVMVVEPTSWRGGIDVHGGTWVQTTEAGEVIEHADPLQVTAHKSSALACLLRGFGCGTRKAFPSCESPAPARGGTRTTSLKIAAVQQVSLSNRMACTVPVE